MTAAEPNPLPPVFDLEHQLSRRERQIMDIIYRLGPSTAAEVMENLPEPPSYSAVRALLRILEQKRLLTHSHNGVKYVYEPTVNPDKAKRSALQHVLQTFFNNSTEKVVATLLDMSEQRITGSELERLTHLIEKAKAEGK